MTNPDNVGGLPAKWLAEADADEKRAGYETAEAMTLRRVAAELCRAAPAGGDSAPAGSGEVEKQARALYVRWVDQQDMHCNRFPSWQELSAKDRQEWFDKVVAADTGNAAVDRVIGRLMSSDPDFDDCAEAAALLRKLQQGADYVVVGYTLPLSDGSLSESAATFDTDHQFKRKIAVPLYAHVSSQDQDGGKHG